jgi:hypothetical protein
MTESDAAKEERIAADRTLVARIAADDDEAWGDFVERYTDWVLYKAREWCVGHCHHHAGDYFCGLTSLALQREGKFPTTSLPECDDGLDTYVWIFEQLKRRAVKYAGKNGCLLSTYVWTLLNARELYIDWLRSRYGRAF